MNNNTEEQLRPGVLIKTFGCQMNEYDSEKMLALLSVDYRPVGSVEEASVIIINTCSVREKGQHKLRSLLGTLRNVKKKNPDLIVGVSGCVAQQEGSQIIKNHPGVNFVVGTHNLSLVPSLVQSALQGQKPQVAVDYRDEWEELPDDFAAYQPDASTSLQGITFGAFYTPARAMVAIQRGCDKNCSFCVVPNTRGPEVSRIPEEIEREVRLKVRLGAREVLLLGQTVNSYGRDLNPRYSFAELICRLAQIPNLFRIRFTSPHPAEFRQDFIDLYQSVDQLCPYIHLPLQSGSDRILKLMNRNYRVSRYLKIVEELKKCCPNIAISSDFIVGFPTETEEDFQGTLLVMKLVRFCSSYSFKYSPRPNTKALELFSSQVQIAPEIISQRLNDLHELQESISLEINREKIGHQIEVLVEGRSKHISSLLRGRTPQNTLVEFSVSEGQDNQTKVGDLVNVNISNASSYGLRGEVVNAAG